MPAECSSAGIADVHHGNTPALQQWVLCSSESLAPWLGEIPIQSMTSHSPSDSKTIPINFEGNAVKYPALWKVPFPEANLKPHWEFHWSLFGNKIPLHVPLHVRSYSGKHSPWWEQPDNFDYLDYLFVKFGPMLHFVSMSKFLCAWTCLWTAQLSNIKGCEMHCCALL